MSELFKLLGTISVTNADANAAIDETTKKANDLKTALEGTNSTASTVSKDAENAASNAEAAYASTQKSATKSVYLGNMMSNIATKAMGFIKDFAKEGMALNAEIEKQTAVYATYMGGDMEKAKAFADDLRKFDKETPFGYESIAKTATSLLNTGVLPEEVIGTLDMLGNMALGDPTKMASLANAYTDVRAAKKMTLQDAKQFVQGGGFPIWDALTASTGYDYETLRTMVSKGQISYDMVNEALNASVSPGGSHYGKMDAIMETTYGQIEALSADYDMFKAKMTESTMSLTDTLVPIASDVLAWASENTDETKLILGTVGVALTKLLASGGHPILAAGMGLLSATGVTEALGSYAKDLFAFNDIVFDDTGTYDVGDKLSAQHGISKAEIYAQLDRDMAARNGIIMPSANASEKEIEAWWDSLEDPAGGTYYWQDRIMALYESNQKMLDIVNEGEKWKTGYDFVMPGTGNTPAYTPPTTWHDSLDDWFYQTFNNTLPSVGYSQKYASPIGPPLPDGWTPSNNAGQSVDVSGLSAQLGTMIGLLSQVVANGRQPIILNTGALVGGIAPALNSALGQIVNRGSK